MLWKVIRKDLPNICTQHIISDSLCPRLQMLE